MVKNCINILINFAQKDVICHQKAIWLLVFLAGLPQLSETVYTPSLPDISKALITSESMTEYTLTIYLLGFAVGVFLWGGISDKKGRKPCMIAGLTLFVIGCLGCYFSQSIEMLMLSRFIQALGGSAGSVITQAICRDAFHGPELGKAFSIVGSALALFPAIGPICGGYIAEFFGWRNIFIFLSFAATLIAVLVKIKLPETHPHATRQKVSTWDVCKTLARDKKVMGYGLIVGGCNGILFSYLAEGSFYLIKGFHLSPSKYGLSFIAIAMATMMGGILSRKLQDRYSSKTIMNFGILIMTLATLFFSAFMIVHSMFYSFSNKTMIVMIICSQMLCGMGICIATLNALALALKDYKHAIGTASSLFGCYYYCFIALFTFIMGLIHDGTLLPMLLYFLTISCFVSIVNFYCFPKTKQSCPA